MLNSRLSFYYDPTRQGYDTTLLKTLSGTPTGTGGVITVNTASFIGYADIFKEDLTLNIVVPAVPTMGDMRIWGLEQLNNKMGAVFTIRDTIFSCICSFEGVTTQITIPWDPSWTANGMDYTIKWTGFSADFFINGVRPSGAQRITDGTTTANTSTTITGTSTLFLSQFKVGDLIALSSAPTTYATVTNIASDILLTVDVPLGNGASQTIVISTETFINDLSVPKMAMSTYVENDNADDLIVQYMEDSNVQGYI